jgi:hypothetical protein
MLPPISHKLLLSGALLLAAAPFLSAIDATFDGRGQVIFSDDFSGSTLAKAWAGKPGKWEMVGDAVKASEMPEDKHAAVRRHPLQYHDAIFEFSFELDGARTVGLSLNNKGGHVCRLMVTSKGMALQVDQPNANSDLKAVRLAASTAPIEAGKWHKAVVEVHGPKMIAQIDDGPAIAGENPRVDVDKTDLGFPVGGVSAKIKGLKVYAVK